MYSVAIRRKSLFFSDASVRARSFVVGHMPVLLNKWEQLLF